jgi:hypothetical protein
MSHIRNSLLIIIGVLGASLAISKTNAVGPWNITNNTGHMIYYNFQFFGYNYEIDPAKTITGANRYFPKDFTSMTVGTCNHKTYYSSLGMYQCDTTSTSKPTFTCTFDPSNTKKNITINKDNTCTLSS